MVDIVRSEYGYADEYILAKRFLRLNNSVELIIRRKYNDNIALANMISVFVGNLIVKKENRVEVKSFDELKEEKNKVYGNHDEQYMSDGFGDFGLSKE